MFWHFGFSFLTNQTLNQESSQFRFGRGFTMQYPAEWNVVEEPKKSGSSAETAFIKSPDGNAFVAVQTFREARLQNPETRRAVYDAVEESFRADMQSKVEYFDWTSGLAEVTTGAESYLAEGIFTDGENKEWRFKEIGILHNEGTVVVLRGMTVRELALKYDKAVSDSILSFSPAPLSKETAAIEKISNRSEVVRYVSELERNGRNVIFDVEDWGEAWGVHVYEIVQQEGESHTATFNWYRVNKKTGEVSLEF